jgi:DNA-directed RNA polymerase subunit RPC12/RpoP
MTKDDEIPKHRSKKNTKKWCKGKEGKMHQPIWEKNDKFHWSKSIWLVYRCQVCSKEIDNYYQGKFLNRDNEYECPTIGSSEPLKLKDK